MPACKTRKKLRAVQKNVVNTYIHYTSPTKLMLDSGTAGQCYSSIGRCILVGKNTTQCGVSTTGHV